MKIAGKFNYKKAILLNQENMVTIETEMLKYCERIEYSAIIQNGNDIQFESLFELLNYDNFNKRKIVSLEMKGYISYTRVIRLVFEKQVGCYINYLKTFACTYEFDSAEKEILFTTTLKDILEKAKTDYWLIGKMTSFSAVVIPCFMSTILKIFFDKFKDAFSMEFSTLAFSIALSIVFLLALLYLDKKFLLKIFNPVVFYWGEEKRRFNKYEKLRSNILWNIVFAIIIGWVVYFTTASW